MGTVAALQGLTDYQQGVLAGLRMSTAPRVAEVYEAACRLPHARAVHISQLSGVEDGLTARALRKLEQAGVIASEPVPGLTRSRTYTARPRPPVDTLTGAARATLALIHETPGINLSQIAHRRGVSPKAAQTTVLRLERAGRIRTERDVTTRRCYPITPETP